MGARAHPWSSLAAGLAAFGPHCVEFVAADL